MGQLRLPKLPNIWIAFTNHSLFPKYGFTLKNMLRRIGFITLPIVLLLSACAPTLIDHRPSDGQLRQGISKLVSEFEKIHPQLVSWSDGAVKRQIADALPTGRATEAGWTIEWSNPTNSELSRVVVPWRLLGVVPKSYVNDSSNYVGGTVTSKKVFAQISWNTAIQISSTREGMDSRFAALVNVRLSKTDPSWAIFTTVPYLPVTDIAYGWAKNEGGYWKVMDFGTALVGCGVTPSRIEKEFGFNCPAN